MCAGAIRPATVTELQEEAARQSSLPRAAANYLVLMAVRESCREPHQIICSNCAAKCFRQCPQCFGQSQYFLVVGSDMPLPGDLVVA